MCFLLMSNDNVLSVGDNAEDVENTGSNIWNYYKVDGAHCSEQTRSHSVTFCETSFTGRAARLFLHRRKQMLELVFQCVKRTIIDMWNLR